MGSLTEEMLELFNSRNAVNETTYGPVCAEFCCRMSLCLKHIRMIAAMYVTSSDLLLTHYAKFIMVAGYTEDLPKTFKVGG